MSHKQKGKKERKEILEKIREARREREIQLNHQKSQNIVEFAARKMEMAALNRTPIGGLGCSKFKDILFKKNLLDGEVSDYCCYQSCGDSSLDSSLDDNNKMTTVKNSLTRCKQKQSIDTEEKTLESDVCLIKARLHIETEELKAKKKKKLEEEREKRKKRRGERNLAHQAKMSQLAAEKAALKRLPKQKEAMKSIQQEFEQAQHIEKETEYTRSLSKIMDGDESISIEDLQSYITKITNIINPYEKVLKKWENNGIVLYIMDELNNREIKKEDIIKYIDYYNKQKEKVENMLNVKKKQDYIISAAREAGYGGNKTKRQKKTKKRKKTKKQKKTKKRKKTKRR